jgi:Zn-dependent protease with chaperone function
MTPLLLGLLALVLAGPTPWLLTRLRVLRTVPRPAMVLWQAAALAAVLAALGAGLSLATESALGTERSGADWLATIFALSITLVVCGRLLWKAHQVGTRLRTARRRQRDLLDILAERDHGVRVLPHETPMAYCIPGLRPQVVLTAATLTALAPDELEAVLGHEKGHLRARHDLVLEAFTVLHEAFPRWVSSRAALDEVAMLVEVLADKAAVRRVGRRPLARALVALAGNSVPDAALSASGPAVVERIRLLSDDSPHRLLGTTTVLVAALVLTLPTIFIALPWISGLDLPTL